MAEKQTAKGSEKNDSYESSQSRQVQPAEIEAFVNGLSEEQKMLVLLKKELYENSWDAMLNDLNNRLDGKPYIFKLANRIKDDIERIQALQTFETSHNIDLTQYVQTPNA